MSNKSFSFERLRILHSYAYASRDHPKTRLTVATDRFGKKKKKGRKKKQKQFLF